MLVAAPPAAPVSTHQTLLLLLQIGLLLGLAVLLGRLARRLGMPAIAGELSAGVLLGPSLLAQVAPGVSGWLLPDSPGQMHLLDSVGQFGVLLLVGVTGMSVDMGLVRRKGAAAARVSVGGALVPLALGVAVGFLLPASLLAEGADRAVFAWFIGVAMCVSAVPVIAKTLLDMRLLHRDIGQMIIAAAAVDDVIGWLLLSVVSAMATTGIRAGEVTLAVGCLAGVLLFAVTGKLAGGYLGARASRCDHWDALALGAGLNARGVIQMIIAMVGLRLGVLTMEMGITCQTVRLPGTCRAAS